MKSSATTLSDTESRLRALMLRGLDGDSSAQHALLSELATLLRNFVGRRLSRNHADVEDLVQETLIAIHTRRHTYDAGQPLTAWVYALARYKLIDHFRRQRVRLTLPLDSVEELFVDDPAIAETAARDVDTLLDGLPAAQGQAIRMTHVEGLSVAEAAARSGMTESALKVSVHRGLKKLSALWGGH